MSTVGPHQSLLLKLLKLLGSLPEETEIAREEATGEGGETIGEGVDDGGGLSGNIAAATEGYSFVIAWRALTF
jgi:hypothetical protein